VISIYRHYTTRMDRNFEIKLKITFLKLEKLIKPEQRLKMKYSSSSSSC